MRREILILMMSVLVAVNLFSFSACGAEQIAEMEKQNEALLERIDALEQQNAQAKTEKDSLQRQINDLHSQMKEKADEIKALNDVIYGPPMESGFYYEYPGYIIFESDGEYLGLRSNRSRFDLDDVTLDFYYGSAFIDLEESCEYYDIYFTTYTYGPYGIDKTFLAKRVEENFFDEEYEVEITETRIEEIRHIDYSFKLFETLTIPGEIFTKDRGEICFELYKQNLEQENTDELFFNATIYYRYEYDKIVISTEWSDIFWENN